MRALHTAVFLTLITSMPNARFAMAQASADVGTAGELATDSFEIFLEPFGSSSSGNADFLDAVAFNDRLGSYETITFDDFDAWPTNDQVPAVTADGVALSVETETTLGGAYIFRSPNYFYWENQIYGGALVVATGATIAPLPGEAEAGAIGFWIYDDGKLRDSIYLVTVTDTCGNVVDAIVENDEPRLGGYEVEGFFGVVSEYGIVELVITVLDAETGEPWADPLELDHLTVGRLHVPRNCPGEEPDADNDQDDDNDGDGRQCETNRRQGRNRGCGRRHRNHHGCERNHDRQDEGNGRPGRGGHHRSRRRGHGG